MKVVYTQTLNQVKRSSGTLITFALRISVVCSVVHSVGQSVTVFCRPCIYDVGTDAKLPGWTHHMFTFTHCVHCTVP